MRLPYQHFHSCEGTLPVPHLGWGESPFFFLPCGHAGFYTFPFTFPEARSPFPGQYLVLGPWILSPKWLETKTIRNLRNLL